MLTGRASAGILLVVLGSWLLFGSVTVPAAGPSTRTDQWKMPRTTWGDPDFESATWNFATMTPLERPRGIEKPVLSEAEAAAFEQQTVERQIANTNNGYDWWDAGSRHLDRRRTSLIVEPVDGHLPPLLPEAQRRSAAAPQGGQRLAEGPEDFPLNTRCVWWQNAGPPMLPSPYNDNVQFIQTRDYVVISNENIHDARIVPTDGRPHGLIRQWLGDSRGRWDRNTLVVDTVNFSSKTSLRRSDENLHIVERFTRVDADTIEYQFRVEDPTVWTQSWTAAFPMHRTDQPIYEFACHEGNFRSMEGLLKVARALERAQGGKGR
jgi:hypothetical protein